ncbi:MAG: hypothetical protein JW833_10940 [Prolixibacteraceae bacterium]|nr:hypothetical protein [Prolixibacteraceae bacterium]
MITRINISNKILIRILLIAVLIGAAVILDNYLDDHPVKLSQNENNDQSGNTQESLFIFNPSIVVNAKQIIQKAPFRFLQTEMHDKFLCKYHQLRNFHVLKAETLNQKIPLFLSYHYLIFRNYYSSLPDDEPSLV